MAADGATRSRRGGDEQRGYSSNSHGSAGYTSKAGGTSAARDRDGNAWHARHSGSRRAQNAACTQPPTEKAVALPAALKGLEEATGCSEWALRCVAAILDNSSTARADVEAALSKVSSWLTSSPERQVLTQFASSSLPAAVVRAIRKFRNETLVAALCCVVLVRSAGSAEVAAAHLRAGALEEIGCLMDKHPCHGGVQNVCLLALCGLLKDGVAARQAVTLGSVARVLRAMEATAGREVQYNGLSALRLLTGEGRAPRAGLLEAAMRAKVAHQNDNIVVTVANEVLALVTPRFKEVLCWHWQSGWCKLGPRCTYAHGPTDLRAT